jgi:hypothetical protein
MKHWLAFSSSTQQSILLFVTLASLYLFTYSGIPAAQDELALFSVTESWVRYGEPAIISAYNFYPGVGSPPWDQSIYEPGQIILAIPLYWLAYQLPGIPIQQTVWLLNVIVTALIGVVMFHIGVRLGFSRMVSGATAGLLGSASILWPYSQTFFREPLFAFWMILGCYWALVWRGERSHKAAFYGLGSVLAMLLTKEVGFLALPSLLILAFPPQAVRRWLMLSLVGVLALVIISQTLGQVLLPSAIRFQSEVYLARTEQSNLAYLLEVAAAYLLSPGYSLWASSPLLILALGGLWSFYQDRHWHLILAPLALLVMLVVGYGLGGREWHGGRGWGARYLLVAVPLVGLWLFPVIEWALEKAWHWLALLPLIAFSWGVQVAGLFVPLQTFYSTLDQRFPGQAPASYFEEGAWQVQQTQWWIQLQHFDLNHAPIALRYTDSSAWGLLIALVTVIALVLLKTNRLRWSALSLIAWMGCASGLILSLRHDPRLLADRAELHYLVAALDQQARSSDMVILSDPEYGLFFMNYYRGGALYTVLPYSPGERESSAAPDPNVIDRDGSGDVNFNERISKVIRDVLDYSLSGDFNNIWLVTNRRPVDTWAYRPVEEFLAFHSYPISEVNYPQQNLSRLIQFGAQPPPVYAIYELPKLTTPYQFGESLALIAYEFPAEAQAGGYIPVTLVWQALATIPSDYHVNVLLLNQDGITVAQRGGIPQGSFGNMQTWYTPSYANLDYRHPDHHGLAIAPSLPAGIYSLQVIVYDWRDSSRPQVTQQGQIIPSGAVELGLVTVRE